MADIIRIFLDGKYSDKPEDIAYYQEEARKPEYLISTDGSIVMLNSWDVIPDLLCGDQDTPGVDFSKVRAREIRKKPDQNMTDGEFAAREALKESPKEVYFYGYGTKGKHNDHYHGNISLLYMLSLEGVKAIAKSPHERIYILSKGYNSIEFPGKREKIVSLVAHAFETVEAVNAVGLKYPVDNASISSKKTKYLRNKVIDDGNVRISIGSGGLLVFYYCD